MGIIRSIFLSNSATARRQEQYLPWYNQQRPHSSLSDKTPDEAYFPMLPAIKTAACPPSVPLKNRKNCPNERGHLWERTTSGVQAQLMALVVSPSYDTEPNVECSQIPRHRAAYALLQLDT
jgi:hypothetical protein